MEEFYNTLAQEFWAEPPFSPMTEIERGFWELYALQNQTEKLKQAPMTKPKLISALITRQQVSCPL